MKVGEPYRLYVNEFLYVDLLFDGDNLHILSSTNIPSPAVAQENIPGKSIILINGIPRFTFNLNNREVLTHLKMIPTTAIRNFEELARSGAGDLDYIKNYAGFKKNINKEFHTHTDLHTHFMEALSGEEFLKLILDKIGYVGVDENFDLVNTYLTVENDPKELDLKGITFITKEQILSSSILYQKLVYQLNLPVDRQLDFMSINGALLKRNALVALVGYQNAKEDIYMEDNPTKERVAEIVSDKKADVYVDILIRTLEVLKSEDVKYVEFSYSTPNTIVKMYNRLFGRNVPSGIEFNFLLSEDRRAHASRFREYFNEGSYFKRNRKSVESYLPKLIENGYITGFDLMGFESEITPSDYEKDVVDGSSLYDKLEMILVKLNSYNDESLVCRLHAGEVVYDMPTYDGKSNPERTLEIIDKIVKKHNLVVPPPRIRIGHGLHFMPNANYLELLKKYKVTVEINASSNFALGNIKSIEDIPYRWYIDNNVPVVLGTDGGGFYLTTPLDESNIAHLFGGLDVINKISMYDNKELNDAKHIGKSM